MTGNLSFINQIQSSYQSLLAEHMDSVPDNDRIKIDLHCHDHNSDVTDELLGRILRFPETWLSTEELVQSLRRNQCNAITVTNHNNARSCWQLLEQGEDVLVGAEFSCHFIEYDAKFHVLAYGFTPEQEEKLNKHRKNIYRFLTYTVENDIPTILPHPLYFHAPKNKMHPEIIEKLVLMFERFEVLNGQRDVWQNLLTWEWLNSLTEEKIEDLQAKHQINSQSFCKNIYKKHYSGGSDDHNGLFVGTCGSYLHVPGLRNKLQAKPLSQLALEAIKNCSIHPFGLVSNHEKLNISLIDYLSQIALHMKEPGLLRMFLHNGTLQDKLLCLGFSNVMQELRRHKFTMFFFKTLHEALKGKRPSLLSRFKITPDFRPLVKKIDTIAKSRDKDPDQYLKLLKSGPTEMFSVLSQVIAKRINNKVSQMQKVDLKDQLDTASLISKFEIPTHFRSLFEGAADRAVDDVSQVNLAEVLDTVSFPVLASSILALSSAISTRVLTNQRSFVNRFAKSIGKHVHPERTLWLTDTLTDKNGVSSSLSAKLAFIQKNDLDIDFLICHDEIDERANLKVVKPITSFEIPSYPDQKFHVPDLLEIQKVFIEGSYDRIVCSTELLMGLVALYLKQSMSVPVYFFMHTDWLEFFIKTTSLENSVIDRIRRILRAFYLQFDGIWVMNQDHKNWLTSPAIGIESHKVFETAHWVDKMFYPRPMDRNKVFGNRVRDDEIAVLYAGRLSDEKGVFDLPAVVEEAKAEGLNLKLLIAGKGPAEERLKEALPDAVFLGWVEKEKMPELYSQVDLLVLPSRFDTFGNVILEAMSCGTAVAAYDEKGPKNIIKSQKNGILAKDLDDLKDKIKLFVKDSTYRHALKTNSLKRAKNYTPEKIMASFVADIGLEKDVIKIKNISKPDQTPQPVTQDKQKFKKAIGY